MLSTRPLTLLLALLLVAPVLAQAEEPKHPSCGETKERVLEPFEKWLDDALLAAKQYAEAVEIKAAATREYLAQLARTDQTFAVAQAADIEKATHAVRHAREAIQLALANQEEAIAKLEKHAAHVRELGQDDAAAQKSIQAARLKLTNGEAWGHSEELHRGDTIRGWETYIENMQTWRRERVAGFAAGEIPLFHPELHSTMAGKAIDERIESTHVDLAHTLAREKPFYLAAVRRTLNGKALDQYVKDQQKALSDAEDAIAAGTYRLYVPTLSRTTDRNHVLALIDTREVALAAIHSEWGLGTYRRYNPKARTTTTNGAFQEDIDRKRKEIADFLAKGDDVALRDGRTTTTGRQLRQALQEANRNGNSDMAAQLTERLSKWEENRQLFLTKSDEFIALREEQIVAHREVFDADVAAREKELKETLTWALGETPCGGSQRSTVDRLRDFVRRNSETEEEARCRQARFDDHVFIRPDGVVLGNPRRGLYEAHRDHPLGDSARFLGEQTLKANPNILAEKALEKLDTAIAGIQDWKDGAELAAHAHAFGKLAHATDRLNTFHRWVSSVPQTAKALAEEGPRIAAEFQDLPQLLEEAAHSRAAIVQAIKDLSRNAVGPEAKALRQTLEDMVAGLDGLEKAGFGKKLVETFNLFRHLELPANPSFWSQMRAGTNQIFQATADDVKASPLARMMLVAGVLKGVADAKQRSREGMHYADAYARSTADFMVDLVIAGVPLVAAGEMVAALGLNIASYVSSDDSYKKSTPSELAKLVTQTTLDAYAWLWQRAGEVGTDDVRDLLERNGNEKDIALALREVESRLASVEAGSLEAERLMNMRRTFRAYLRALEGTCDLKGFDESE